MEAVRTIAIPDSIHAKLKQLAQKRDVPIKALVVEILPPEELQGIASESKDLMLEGK
jgi:hypothetical protein